MLDLQRASLWKRISAFLFDFILLGIAAALFAFALSAAVGYDRQIETFQARCDYYAAQYGVEYQLSIAEFEQLSQEETQRLAEAEQALRQDEQAAYAYEMMMRLALAILSVSLLLAALIFEFFIPLALGNGQTLGKKIFSLGVMRTEGIRVNGVCLFIRAILGKYTLETMIPVSLLLMLYFGTLGLTGTVVLLAMGALQLILLLATYRHTPLHDLLAGTVEIDLPSQMIFDSREALIAYKEKMQAERAAAQPS